MKKILALFLILAFCSGAFCGGAFADDGTDAASSFNWEDYSLEELQAIQEGLLKVIAEKQRQYAIEHGDRKITISDIPEHIYSTKTCTLGATVERVLDTAPEQTKLLWKSSDDTIATVSQAGVVKGIGMGERVSLSGIRIDTLFISP